MTLRRKLLVSLLLTLLPLGGLGITAYVLVRDSLLDEARLDVEARAALRADDLTRRLEIAQGELLSIASWPDLSVPANADDVLADPSVLSDPLAAVSTWWGQFRELAVVRRDGLVIAATDPGFGARLVLDDVRAPAVSSPSLVDGRWLLSVSRPIGLGADVFVVAEIASEFLIPGGLVQADATEFGRAGAVVANGSKGRVLTYVADHENAAAAADMALRLAVGDVDLVGVSPAADSQFLVAVAADEDSVLQPLDRLGLAIAVAVAAAGVVVALLAWILGRTISARIGKLRDVTTALGSGDWSRRAGDLGSDELGDLSVSFDKMADQLATDNQRRREIQDELSHQALHDPLTGLANRVKFLDRLNDALARSSRSGAPVAVLFCDLDNLKTVNDRFGHTAGDDLLTGVADRFRNSVRPSDTVARFGGDEFVVLCAEMAAAEDAMVVADRLSAALLQPFDIGNTTVNTTASIGIAVGSGASSGAEDLVRDADSAMYEAKEGGKAKYVVHSDSLGDRTQRREGRVREVSTALDEGQLRLEYQPVVELETGRVVHVETFVRWDHPDRGVVGPADLLAQFAEAGASVELDRWVIEAGLAQVAVWNRTRPDQPAVKLSVNVTRASMQDEGLAEFVERTIDRHGIDPGQLLIEISEPTMADNPGAAAAAVDSLRELGIGLVLDDFGIGHTSIERLQRYGFDTMKLDGSLIAGLGRGEGHSPVVAALSLANALDMTAVAEAVERVEQVPELLQNGCQFAQGHLFCAPIDAVGLEPWLDRLEL